MAAAFTAALTECAPGNIVTLAGSDLTGVTEVVLGDQLVVPDDGTPPTYDGTKTIPATTNGTSVTFTVPDNVRSGDLSATAGDSTVATTALRITSQYVQADEYSIGTEGTDVSGLAAGVLDQVLREASAWADAYCGAGDENMNGFRLLQSVEKHKYVARPKGPPRFFVWRPRAFRSLDQLVFLTSNVIRTNFDVSQLSSSDIFVNDSLHYLEVLAYAFGNYVLLGMIETIGFSANVVEISYTAGYSYKNYPAALRKATSVIATELLTYRRIQFGGMGGFATVRKGLQQYDRRQEPFAIPGPAKDLLRPFVSRTLA